jgi:hypothetical protein
MARIPVIESPCPLEGKSIPAGATRHCTHCDRTVHNLNRMSERQRREFMSSCSGKVCVAYTVRIPIRHRGLAVASLAAAAAMALPAAAAPPSDATEPPVGAMSPVPAAPGATPHLPNCNDYYWEEVLVGGVSRGDQAEWADDGKNAPPELPTIEDDGK